MNDDEVLQPVDESAQAEGCLPVTWLWDVSSWIFLTLGFVAFELTSDVTLGIAVTCLKLGGGDVLTAIWARRDPLSHRGGSLSCFCFASACFRIAGVALLICVALVLWAELFQMPFKVEKFIAGLCLIFVGIFLGTISGVIGLTIALRYQWPIWLDAEFRKSRRYRQFPPVYVGTRNQLPWILMVTQFHVYSAVAMLLIGCLSMVLFNPGNLRDALGLLVCYSLLLSFPVAQLLRRHRIIAQSPEQCWVELLAE